MRLAIALLCAGMAYAQSLPLGGIPVATGGGGGISITWSGVGTYLNGTGTLVNAATPVTTPQSLSISTGDVLTFILGNSDSMTGTTAVTCGASNTLTQGASWHSTTDSYYYRLFYKINAVAATTTCSVTFDQAANWISIAATNWHVSGGTASFGQASCNDAGCAALATAATSRTAQNVTTAVATSLLVGTWLNWDNDATPTGANGYSVAVGGGIPGIVYKVVTSTGTHPTSPFATTTSQKYTSIFATFGVQ